jgi:hypothetical protein
MSVIMYALECDAVLEEYIASVFRAEEQAKQVTSENFI